MVNRFIDISVVKYVAGVPRSICNNKQTQKDLQKRPIFITNADHDYTLN